MKRNIGIVSVQENDMVRKERGKEDVKKVENNEEGKEEEEDNIDDNDENEHL